MSNVVPSDTKLENSVLGCIVLYPKLLNVARNYITTDDVFYQAKAKSLWSLLKSMQQKKEFIDLTTVGASLKDENTLVGCTNMYVVDCTMAAGTEISFEMYLKKLYEKYLMRRVVEETSKIQQDAMGGGDGAYDCIVSAHTLFLSLIHI